MADIGIPIPPSRSILPGRKRNPDTMAGKIRALKVGESLFSRKGQPYLSMTACAQVANGRVPAGTAYTTRKVRGGARIWRTA